jgi:phage-related holin
MLLEVVEEVVIMVVVAVNQVMHLLMELAAVVRVQSIAMVVPDKLIQVVEGLVQTNQLQDNQLIRIKEVLVDLVLW